MWYSFWKIGHRGLFLLRVTRSGWLHALMEFRLSGANEKQDMGLSLKTEYSTFSQNQVLIRLTWARLFKTNNVVS